MKNIIRSFFVLAAFVLIFKDAAVSSYVQKVLSIGNEGSTLTHRPVLNFTGNGINCTDNSGSNRTDCDVGGTSPSIQEVFTTVTSSELLNLVATPKQLVAAQGAGTALVVINYVIKYNAVTTDYTNPSGSLFIRVGTSSAIAGANFAAVTAAGSAFFGPVGPISNLVSRTNMADLENAPIQLAKSTSDLTGGDGTLSIRLRYMVTTFP